VESQVSDKYFEEGIPEGKNLVRLVYIDETGIDSDKIGVVAAVIVHGDKQLPLINREVRPIIAKCPGSDRPNFEFKANRLYSQYRKHGENSIYGEVMHDFLTVMSKFSLPIRYWAVDKPPLEDLRANLPEHMTVNDMCFVNTIIGTARWMRKNAPDEAAVCISDKSRDEVKLDTYIRAFRGLGPKYIIPVPDSLLYLYECIADTIFFSDSHKSIGIQMADHANFFMRTHLLGDEHAEPFYKLIEPLLDGPAHFCL